MKRPVISLVQVGTEADRAEPSAEFRCSLFFVTVPLVRDKVSRTSVWYSEHWLEIRTPAPDLVKTNCSIGRVA